MAVKTKLKINQELTDNTNIVLQDITGRYTPTNPEGYGGPNGLPTTNILKYIFRLKNIFTNTVYYQRHADVQENGYFINPSIGRIANSENVQVMAYNQELASFKDGQYNIDMNVVFDIPSSGDGFKDTDVIVNVPNYSLINEFDAILVGDTIYDIDNTRQPIQSTILLTSNIINSFNSFRPILRASNEVLLSDELRGCIDKRIAELASNCDCDNTKDINALLEVQLLLWGIDRAISKNEVSLAYDYFKSALRLCKCKNCGCNG